MRMASEDRSKIEIGGDANIMDGISNAEIVVQGRDNTVSVNKTGIDSTELNQVIQGIFDLIERREEDSNVDKSEIVDEVAKIQNEAAAPEPNGHKILRWLSNLGEMAPDIAEVFATTLGNPIAGVALGVSKVAKKYLEQLSKG